MSEYEIKCQETWAWYRGYVQDYDNTKKEFYVTYPTDWKEPEWVAPESVRRIPPPFPPHWLARVGDQVECQARAEENEPLGWWGCKVKNVQRDRYVVSFDGWDDQHNECLLRSLVRPRSTQIPLNPEDIVRDSIIIPDELVDWVCSHPKELSSLQDLKSRMFHMNVNGETKELIIVAPERELTMARDIISMIFDKRKKLYELELAMKSKEERVRKRKEEESKAIRIEFRIHPLLVGYLYGKNRQNISKENLPADITAVRLEEGKCTVFGKTQESVLECKEILHIVAKKILLSSSETWFLVGAGGKDIRNMKTQSGVQRLITHRRWMEELKLLKERAIDHFRDRRSGRGGGGRGGRRGGRRGGGSSRDTSEESDEYSSTLTLIENTDEDDLFEEGDILDMSNGADQDSYLVIIGREDRVNLCLTMIEMALNAVRRISTTRTRVNALRDQISQIKGFTPGRKGRKGRGRGGGGPGGSGGGSGSGSADMEGSMDDGPSDTPPRGGGRRGGGRGPGGGGGGGRSGRRGGTPGDDDRKGGGSGGPGGGGGDDGRPDYGGDRRRGRGSRGGGGGGRRGGSGSGGSRQDGGRPDRRKDDSGDSRGGSFRRDSDRSYKKAGGGGEMPPSSDTGGKTSGGSPPSSTKKRRRQRGRRKGGASSGGGTGSGSSEVDASSKPAAQPAD